MSCCQHVTTAEAETLLDALTKGSFRPMRVWISSGMNRYPSNKRKMMEQDVVIHNGVIIKNRNGPPGAKVGRAVYVWDEEKA